MCPFPEKAGYQSPYGGMDNGVVSFVLFLALFYLFSPSLDVEMKLFISEWGPPFLEVVGILLQVCNCCYPVSFDGWRCAERAINFVG